MKKIWVWSVFAFLVGNNIQAQRHGHGSERWEHGYGEQHGYRQEGNYNNNRGYAAPPPQPVYGYRNGYNGYHNGCNGYNAPAPVVVVAPPPPPPPRRISFYYYPIANVYFCPLTGTYSFLYNGYWSEAAYLPNGHYPNEPFQEVFCYEGDRIWNYNNAHCQSFRPRCQRPGFNINIRF